jgi:hypothetical protein
MPSFLYKKKTISTTAICGYAVNFIPFLMNVCVRPPLCVCVRECVARLIHAHSGKPSSLALSQLITTLEEQKKVRHQGCDC